MLNDFRSTIRKQAREKKPYTDILDACGHVRDEVLPVLGVVLEDKTDISVWKLENPDTLKKEMQLKKEEKEKREAQKREQKEKQEKLAAQAKIPATAWFQSDFYKKENPTNAAALTKFDEKGMPTHVLDKEKGEIAVPKSMLKKLEKEYKKQEQLHATQGKQ